MRQLVDKLCFEPCFEAAFGGTLRYGVPFARVDGFGRGEGGWQEVEMAHGSDIHLFVTPWTVVRQAPQSMGFPRQEYWSGLSFPSPGDLPDPGIKPFFLPWQEDYLPLSHQGSPYHLLCFEVERTIDVGALMLPGGTSGKEPASQCRRHKRHRFDPWVGKIPWRRAW